MNNDDILYNYESRIGVLTINRQKVMNAMDTGFIAALTTFLGEIADSDIRCLVITGAGEKSFVAGADLREMKDMNRAQAENLCRAGNAAMRRLEAFPAPVVAAINGYALGGGLELALACDIRIASENASFALPETTFGIVPGYGGAQRLSRILGQGRARELVFTARRFGAQEALAWGLINAVHPLAELMPNAMKLAESIAVNAPIAVKAAKRVMNDSVGLALSEADQLEREIFGTCFGTWDQREAMQAFVDKRKPQPFIG
jgi:enoyl-CoA hydratase